MVACFRAASFFTGAGGMDIGVAEAGFDVALASDIDEHACATYRLNHATPIVHGDFLKTDFSARIPEEIDLMFGGPPCQGFSVAGMMDPDDPRSRLIVEFMKLVDAVRPRAFICENVKSLAILNRFRNVREALLARDGYHVSLLVLKASDFGVPQMRERAFFIGMRKDACPIDGEAFGPVLEERLRALHSRPETVGDVIRRLGPAGSDTNPQTCTARIVYARNPVLRRSPYAGYLFNGAGRPVDPSGLAPTLPASMGGNRTPIVDENEIFQGEPSFVERYHADLMKGGAPRVGEAPAFLRRLTLSECLILQGFPADYRLSGPTTARYRQIGNAVPPPMARAIASVLGRLLS